jgi:hypothetical protein
MIFDIGILDCWLRLDSVLGRHCVCRGQYNSIFSLLFCNLLNRWVLQCSMDHVGHCIVYAQELLTYKEIKPRGFWYCYWVSGSWHLTVLRVHCVSISFEVALLCSNRLSEPRSPFFANWCPVLSWFILVHSCVNSLMYLVIKYWRMTLDIPTVCPTAVTQWTSLEFGITYFMGFVHFHLLRNNKNE